MLYSHMVSTLRWQATREEMGEEPQRNSLKRVKRVAEGKIEWGEIEKWMGLKRERGMSGG